MRVIVAVAGIVGIGAQAACAHSAPVASATSSPNPAITTGEDTLAAIRERAVASVLQRIAGRENEPADRVFRNVKVLGTVPARQFLEIMNDGFGHGLGVSCGFCHVPGQWASDERPHKAIARDMIGMVNRVNADLHGMTNLPDANPTIGCITCHRMRSKPLLVNMH